MSIEIQIPVVPVPEEAPLQRLSVLVGISSSQARSDRRQAIRETWLASPPDGIGYRFFPAGEPPSIEEPDTIGLGRPAEDHASLKGFGFFEWAIKSYAFDWLLLCDDSSYVALDNLPAMIEPDVDIFRSPVRTVRPFEEGTYLISRAMVETIAGDRSLQAGPLGTLIGQAANRCHARVRVDLRLASTFHGLLAKGNDRISCDGCEPWKQRQLHRLRQDRNLVEVAVEHPGWKDNLFLSSDGYFCRASTECDGRWKSSEEGVNVLEWRRWGTEFLIPFGQNRENGSPSYLCRPREARILTVEVSEGLGNQMFQYAHALALAHRLGAVTKVGFRGGGRSFGLDRFGIFQNAVASPDDDLFEDYGGRQWGAKWPSYAHFERSTSKHLRLAGTFQNENYFLPVATEIRNIFKVTPLRPPGTENKNLVIVHVRRGDFVGKFSHDLCSSSYYRLGMQMIRSILDDPYFLIVSDDPSWCRENFPTGDDLMIWPEHRDDEAMAVMVAGDAFILSNSTFAWWSAWLADKPIVIAPEPYVAGGLWDLVPPRWIRLPASGIKGVPPSSKAADVTVGLLIFATGKYTSFLDDLIAGADKYFLPQHDVSYFIFSDQSPEIQSRREAHLCKADHGPWPAAVLQRYKTFLSSRESLMDFDYLYCCDADMRFIGVIGPEIFGNRVAVQHPLFYGLRGTPETRPASKAFISEDVPMQYFCGGFLGGTGSEFLRMAETLTENIEDDLQRNIVAIWHDESHGNRWFVDNPPDVILDPGYCWPRECNLPFSPKLEALEKNHAEMRS